MVIPLIGAAIMLPFVTLPTLITYYDHSKLIQDGSLSVPERSWIIQKLSLQNIFGVQTPGNLADGGGATRLHSSGQESTLQKILNATLATRHVFNFKHFKARGSRLRTVAMALLFIPRLIFDKKRGFN